MATKRTGKFGSYYGSTYSESEALSEAQQNINAQYITSYLLSEGWSLNAICGMLGNMTAESTINPGRWQSDNVGNTSSGYGLVQWTPATRYLNWCSEQGYSDPSEMDTNLKRILYELKNNLDWIATNSYNISFSAFSNSSEGAGYLAKAFLLNYERPADQSTSVQEYRASLGEKWYSYLLNEYEPSFTPRLDSNGIEGSFYWYSENPFYQSGYGLPNCTCYAWGRFWEISDHNGTGENKPTLPTGDAGTWYPNVTGYTKSQSPQLGAVICWNHTGGGAGHVGIVEQINEDGSLLISNSAWGGSFFYLMTVYPSNGYDINENYSFQGFILNPHLIYIDIPTDPGTYQKKRKGYNFVLFNNRRKKQWIMNSLLKR